MIIDSISRYRRNKNVHFDGVDNSYIVAGLGKLLDIWGRSKKVRQNVVISERIVEYPLIFQHMDKDAKEVLDFGCVEGVLPLHLCSMGYRTTGFDFRPYPFDHPLFSFIQGDILEWKPENEKYDVIISSSTVEHVGLNAYGDPVQEDGDKLAVANLFKALKPGGQMLLTMPAGKSCTKRGMRIYDETTVKALVPEGAKIELLKFYSKPSRYGYWKESSAQEIAGLEYDEYFTMVPAQGVVFMTLRK